MRGVAGGNQRATKHGDCVSVSSEPSFVVVEATLCVWSEWFPSSSGEQISQTLQSHTQPPMSAERKERERSNKQGPFDPAAAQQPAKFPLS